MPRPTPPQKAPAACERVYRLRVAERLDASRVLAHAKAVPWVLPMTSPNRSDIEQALTPEEAAALLWVIHGMPCMWSEKGPCPYCEKRRAEYLTAEAKLEAIAR